MGTTIACIANTFFASSRKEKEMPMPTPIEAKIYDEERAEIEGYFLVREAPGNEFPGFSREDHKIQALRRPGATTQKRNRALKPLSLPKGPGTNPMPPQGNYYPADTIPSKVPATTESCTRDKPRHALFESADSST